MKDHCDKEGIALFPSSAKDDHNQRSDGDRLGIVDRAVKTLRKLITNYQIAHKTTKFIDKLPALVSNYNNTPHSSLQQKTPQQVREDPDFQRRLYDRAMTYNIKLDEVVGLEAGDRVRVQLLKGTFDKESARFSDEIYTVVAKEGTRYRLKDAAGNTVSKLYKYFQLKKVTGEVKGTAAGISNLVAAKERAAAKRRGKAAKIDDL